MVCFCSEKYGLRHRPLCILMQMIMWEYCNQEEVASWTEVNDVWRTVVVFGLMWVLERCM